MTAGVLLFIKSEYIMTLLSTLRLVKCALKVLISPLFSDILLISVVLPLPKEPVIIRCFLPDNL